MDLIHQHFTAIFWTSMALLGVCLVIVVELFRMYRADAVREGKDDPTKIAAALTLSTIKGVLRLRRATDPEPGPRIARTSAELDMTITPGSLRASDIPKEPKP